MKQNFSSLLIITITLGLCSCSLTPTYQRPALPVVAKYHDRILSGKRLVGNKITSDIAWQEYFCDPYLQQLITKALANNRDLRIAVLRVERAQAMYNIERSKLFPSVSADTNILQTRIPSSLSFTKASHVSHIYGAGFGAIAWEVDFWGKIRNLKQSALENFLATDAAQRAVRLSLITQISDNYLSLCELSEQIGIAKKTIISYQKSFRIFTRKFQTGAISRIDLLQVETLLTQAQAFCTVLEQARDTQINALILLVGSPLNSLPQNLHLNNNILLSQLRVGLPSELLIARPEIIAAEHKLKAAGADIGVARAAFFPSIKLTGMYGSASNELSGLFKAGSDFWSFMPNLTLPIFNAGRNIATLKVAKADQQIAVADYEKTIQTAFREVSDALSAHYWLVQQVQIQQHMVTTGRKRLHLAELRYSNGAAPYLEVLDAERDLLRAKQQLVQAQKSLLSSRVKLYSALGGGSQKFNQS